MNRRKTILFAVLSVAVVLAWNFRERMSIGWNMAQQHFSKRTVKDRLKEFGSAARLRWAPHFNAAGVTYPPSRVTFVALKQERMFEVWAAGATNMSLIKRYPVLAASGGPGPKLREGDKQVPEGVYEIESLNPNSAFHVALRLNYPNAFDRTQAAKDARTNLGGDIMIHGKSASIGCLALGDEAAEDVFTLAADVGLKNVKVICSPVDFRRVDLPTMEQIPAWTGELYSRIKAEMTALPLPK
jgi:murein L,D-transpeptidase YafK